jgi:uncharacterized protein YdhG (YjbR/CyaY superfamily)
MMKAPKTVNAYVKAYPKDVQARLQKMRATIKKAAPGAVESISYMMIGYKLDGRPLVYLGGFKNHVGFFAMPSGKTAFSKELAKYQGAKSGVQFQNDEPLPLGLVTKIVKYRMKENRERAKR